MRSKTVQQAFEFAIKTGPKLALESTEQEIAKIKGMSGKWTKQSAQALKVRLNLAELLRNDLVSYLEGQTVYGHSLPKDSK